MSDKKGETFEMLFSMKNKMDHFFAVSEAEFKNGVLRVNAVKKVLTPPGRVL